MSRPKGLKDQFKCKRIGNGLAGQRLPGNGHVPSDWSALRGTSKIKTPVQRIADMVWADILGKKRGRV